MKIIQSFWAAKQNYRETSFGWNLPRFHAISWALSCIQLSKFYEVELYTDKLGYEFLIEKLKLPYSKVHVVLNDLDDFHKDFWALPKIKAYLVQNEPFLHVDGDVFIWEKFSDELLKSGIITQNLEITTEYYKAMWREIYPNLDFIPAEIEGYVSSKNNFACNMGIFGGNDLAFIQKYSRKSFEFAERNKKLSDKISGGNFNIFFEQVLLYEILQIENKESNFLIDEVSQDNEYTGFGNFDEVPFTRTYLHLLGFYKRVYSVCKLMEVYFISYFPNIFKNVVELFSENYLSFNNSLKYEFSLEENIQRYNSFLDSSLNEAVDDNYLLNRDISCIRQHEFLNDCITNDKNFLISRLKGNMVENISDEELMYNKNFHDSPDVRKVLIVEELNGEKSIIHIDDIDEIILEKLENEILYFDLKKQMLDLLDEDAQEIYNDFLKMINDRIIYYLKNRIIIVKNQKLA